jgi:uncharacterized protein YcsI (UPF0317 family)
MAPSAIITKPGQLAFRPGTAVDARTDAPRYKVFRDGVVNDRPTSGISGAMISWPFATGCSSSFEEALIETGLRIRHHDQGLNVPMYVSSIATNPTPPFSGKMVVSMRPFRPAGLQGSGYDRGLSRVTRVVPPRLLPQKAL